MKKAEKTILEVLVWFSVFAVISLLTINYAVLPIMAEHDRLMNEPIVEGSLEQWRDAKRRAISISGCWEWSDKAKRFVVYELKNC